MILRRRKCQRQFTLKPQSLLDRKLNAPGDRFLYRYHRQRGAKADSRCDLFCSSHELIDRDNPVHQPHSECFNGIDRLTREAYLQRFGSPYQARQALRTPCPSQPPTTYFHHPELRILSRDTHVACQCQFKTATHGPTTNGSNHRLVDRCHGLMMRMNTWLVPSPAFFEEGNLIGLPRSLLEI